MGFGTEGGKQGAAWYAGCGRRRSPPAWGVWRRVGEGVAVALERGALPMALPGWCLWRSGTGQQRAARVHLRAGPAGAGALGGACVGGVLRLACFVGLVLGLLI